MNGIAIFHFSRRFVITLFLTLTIFSSLFTGLLYGAKQAMAQNATSVNPLSSSMDAAKTLVNDAIGHYNLAILMTC